MAYMKDSTGVRLDDLHVGTAPILDTGSGYAARPATSLLPAGLALFQGPAAPSDAVAGDRWNPTTSPRRVIIDTDFYTDVDDVVAMRVASYYERIGTFDVLGCIVDTAGSANAPALDSCWRNGESRVMQIGQIDGDHSDLTSTGTYQAYLNGLSHYGGTDASVFPDAMTVYRTLLAGSPNNSVEIISIGYMSALWQLLQTSGDSIDSRTGAQLVAAKVKHLWVMGGTYPNGTENNFSRSSQTKIAANYVVANWPAPSGWVNTDAPYVTFLGYEVGATVITGGNLASAASASDVVLNCLTAYGMPQGRSSWDPMCVQLAALGATAAGYTTVRGTNAVNSSSGANTFTTSSTGPHRYVVKAQADTWYRDKINPLLLPGRRYEPPTGLQVLRSDGAWVPASWRDKQNGRLSPVIVGNTDLGSTLIAAFDAADITGVSDGATFSTAPAHGGGPTWSAPSGKEPTYKSGVSGAQTYPTANSTQSYACAQFAGAQVLDTASAVQGTASMTIYARVMWTTLPTAATQTPVAMDNGGTQRQFHLSVLADSADGATDGNCQAQGNGFANSAANQPGSTAGASLLDKKPGVQANKWHLVVLRITGAGAEVFVDGVSDGSSPISPSNYFPTVANVIAEIGAWTQSGTLREPTTGYVAKARVYTGAHSDTKIASVAAAI